MMPGKGPPPTGFYIYSIIFGIITGIIYAVIYSIINKSIPGKTITKQGLYFGFILFLLGIPWSLTMFLIINLPSLLVVYWSITSLVIDLIFGVIVTKLLK